MVNTFLPVANFSQAAKLLDNSRLGKQRVEARQILDTLEGRTSGWKNHPIVRSWRGYEMALKYYTNCIIEEWVARGNRNDLPLYEIDKSQMIRPWWCDWDKLHTNHRAMLLLKNPARYSELFVGKLAVPSEYLQVGYIWPYKIEDPNLPLDQLAEPLAKILQDPKYCKAIYKTGYYKGLECSNVIRDPLKNDQFCGTHRRKKV